MSAQVGCPIKLGCSRRTIASVWTAVNTRSLKRRKVLDRVAPHPYIAVKLRSRLCARCTGNRAWVPRPSWQRDCARFATTRDPATQIAWPILRTLSLLGRHANEPLQFSIVIVYGNDVHVAACRQQGACRPGRLGDELADPILQGHSGRTGILSTPSSTTPRRSARQHSATRHTPRFPMGPLLPITARRSPTAEPATKHWISTSTPPGFRQATVFPISVTGTNTVSGAARDAWPARSASWPTPRRHVLGRANSQLHVDANGRHSKHRELL